MTLEMEINTPIPNARLFFHDLEPEIRNSMDVLADWTSLSDAKEVGYLITKALAYNDMKIHPDNFEIGAKIVGETARIIKHVSLEAPPYIPISFAQEMHVIDWLEGMFDLSLSWTGVDTQPIRLYQLGVSADQYGRLSIKKVQKHRLGLSYRTTEQATLNNSLQEKQVGDDIWRTIADQSGHPPELFGFLVASMLYGPHAKNGHIVFPTPDLQPEIIKRRQNIERILKGEASDINNDEDSLLKLGTQIEMIRERTNFERMLRGMSVESWPDTRPGYFVTTVEKILQGIHSTWTDDAGHDRHELRRILYTLYQMQS